MRSTDDWEDLTGIRVERSYQYNHFTWNHAVTIYRGRTLVLPDMSPRVLEWCKFPKLLCEVARLTAEDGKVRTIHEDGTVMAKVPLYVPPPKPKLVLPTPKPKVTLTIPEED